MLVGDDGGFDYQRYLASREWALRREAVRERSGGWCERCGTAPMKAVHHLTYANKGREPLEDLQAICDDCHRFVSGKSGYDPAVAKEWSLVDVAGELIRQGVEISLVLELLSLWNAQHGRPPLRDDEVKQTIERVCHTNVARRRRLRESEYAQEEIS